MTRQALQVPPSPTLKLALSVVPVDGSVGMFSTEREPNFALKANVQSRFVYPVSPGIVMMPRA
jgi:hypothetical protein